MKCLSLFLIFTVCSSHPYQLHLDSSYFASHINLKNQKANISSRMNQDSTITLNGIYSNSNLFLDKYPLVRGFDKSSGFFSIPLTEKINSQTDLLLKIKGKVTKVPQKYPLINKVSYHKHLLVISYEELKNLKNIKKAVNQEYQKIMENLQKKITHKGSKLQLTSKPNWITWYYKTEQKFIFASHQYDLMYAVDIEFVVDVETEKITDVYAREWFKGE